MLNKIHNMDCVAGMKMLPDNSVDLTVTRAFRGILKQQQENCTESQSKVALSFGLSMTQP